MVFALKNMTFVMGFWWFLQKKQRPLKAAA
jgi:hypothetical protein